MAQLKVCSLCASLTMTVRVWPGDALHVGPHRRSVSRVCVGCMSAAGLTRRQLNSRIRRDDHRDDVEAIGLGLLNPLTGEIVLAPSEVL